MSLHENKCTGCYNCEKLCPTKAIKITVTNGKYIKKIDLDKCINCEKCNESCPVNESAEKSECMQTYVGRLMDENLINKSSSGGIFGEIAREAIKNGWIIYGAGFDEEFKLEHKRVCNIKELDKILKSKYVRSNLKNTFELTERDLKEGKNVIFSGTPCQIAALKMYLKNDYDNLYTIDLICHGTPRNDIWEKYIKELQEKFNSKIIEIDFRYNNPKEPEKNYYIKFNNGKEINMILYDSIFGKAFLQNMILYDSCYNCNFSNSSNYSDITLGDAHGYVNEKYPVKRSLIITHTNKGNKLFETIKDRLILFDDFSKDALVNSNYPIIYPAIPHYNSDNIEVGKGKSIIEILDTNLKDKYKKMQYNKKNVAILNFHYENYNYGANLVAYSLSKVIEKLGYIPYIIDYDPFLPLDTMARYRTKALLDFRIKYLNMTPNIYDGAELKVLNKYFDTFIVGSDQVWRKAITKENMFRYFLDFVDYDKRCISYGASFGNSNFEGTEEEKAKAKILLKKFSDISVRELDAINIVKDNFKNEAKVVLDPTLLLTKEDYTIFKPKSKKEGYIAYYVLFDQQDGFLEEMHKLFPDKELVNIKGQKEIVPLLGREEFKYNSMEEWISGIKNADFIITDSYHGLLFSLLFNKEFICLANNSKAKSRFDSLVNIIGGNIENRLFGELSEIEDINNLKKLDYKIIAGNIKKYRKESMEFLATSLDKTIKDNDEAMLLNKYYNEIENLKHSIKELNIKNQNEIECIKNELNTRNANEINAMREEMNTSEKMYRNNINKLMEDKSALNSNITELNDIINGIYASKSWKITKPLRKIMKKITKNK